MWVVDGRLVPDTRAPAALVRDLADTLKKALRDFHEVWESMMTSEASLGDPNYRQGVVTVMMKVLGAEFQGLRFDLAPADFVEDTGDWSAVNLLARDGILVVGVTARGLEEPDAGWIDHIASGHWPADRSYWQGVLARAAAARMAQKASSCLVQKRLKTVTQAGSEL
jgi:hypothetical protein